MSLPAAAWGPVSSVLGRDLPAYRVVGLGARNAAQGFGVRFSRTGATVSSGGGRLGIALSAVGYGNALRGVGLVAPRVSGDRVSYVYRSLTAWWVNGPLGLEEGFDLSARPGAGGCPLTVSLAFSGGLRARMEHGLVLLSGSNVALSYGGLVVSDAHGRLLRSWLRLVRGGVLIQADDRGAVYPLRIDPFVQRAELTASDGANDNHFGLSVGVSGDTIVVGAEFHEVGRHPSQGEAYVFVRPASGWANARETARLTASNGAAGDDFGESVAVSGDTIVVGAGFHRVGKHRQQGEAYVFVRPRSGWAGARTQTATLTTSNGAAYDWFGGYVAISGDTIVARAYTHTIGAHRQQGEVYVFVRPRSGWAGAHTQTATLTASNGAANDWFGWSVAVSGDTIVVGAVSHKVGKHVNQGEAYVFVRPRSGWAGARTQTATLTASNGAARDTFGGSVAVSGDTIVASAPERKVGTHIQQGEAYVFVRPKSGWAGARTQAATLTESDGAAEDLFGDFIGSVAVSGDTIVIGSPSRTFGENLDQGEAYVFVRPKSGWAGARTQAATLTASNGAFGDYFGSSVAMSGNTIIIGAPFHPPIGQHKLSGPGEAYVFHEQIHDKPGAGIARPGERALSGGQSEKFEASWPAHALLPHSADAAARPGNRCTAAPGSRSDSYQSTAGRLSGRDPLPRRAPPAAAISARRRPRVRIGGPVSFQTTVGYPDANDRVRDRASRWPPLIKRRKPRTAPPGTDRTQTPPPSTAPKPKSEAGPSYARRAGSPRLATALSRSPPGHLLAEAPRSSKQCDALAHSHRCKTRASESGDRARRCFRRLPSAAAVEGRSGARDQLTGRPLMQRRLGHLRSPVPRWVGPEIQLPAAECRAGHWSARRCRNSSR